MISILIQEQYSATILLEKKEFETLCKWYTVQHPMVNFPLKNLEAFL